MDPEGQPPEEIWVHIVGASTGTRGIWIQEDGSYVTNPLPPGNYLVYVEPFYSDYIREYYNNVYSCDAATLVEVVAGQRKAGIDFELARGSQITGVVRDPDGQPVKGVWVHAGDEPGCHNRSDLTGADGSYAVKGLPAGKYYIWGKHPLPDI